MHQNKKSFWVILGVLILLSLGNLGIIYFVNPSSPIIEIGELVLLGIFLLLALSWVIGKLKWGAIVTGAILASLILRRFDLLNWISLGTGLVIFGLISLI